MTTGTTTICKEIVITAAPERIWRALTVPEERMQWEVRFAAIELRIGGRIELDYGQVRDSGTITELVPLQRLAYQSSRGIWTAWTLIPEASGTRVRVELGDFAEDDGGQAYSEGAGFAFGLFLANLKSLLEQGLDLRDNWWRGSIGFGFISLRDRHARQCAEDTGTLVLGVSPESPAAVAGLRAGDVIVSVNGGPVTGYADLAEVTVASAPGDRLQLGIMREGTRSNVEVSVA